MLKLLWQILTDETGDTLTVPYSFSANTLISSSEVNENNDAIEAVVNALTADNYAADSVGPLALASTVVRTNYGLIQHTDGTLYVDVSDTNPCLELTDGGLRVKVDGTTITRGASGLVASVVSDHGALTGLDDDDHSAIYLNTTRHDADDHSGLPSTPTASSPLKLDANSKWPVATIPEVLGAWASRTENTIYQAATDGFFVGYDSTGNPGEIIFYTDSSTPPTTVRTKNSSGYGNSGVCCPVKKGDYYKYETTGTGIGFWIPLGN